MNANVDIQQAPRIVIIEDEPDIGTLLEYVLDREGFRVDVARSGQEGIETCRREPPDLILLDLMLPDVDGLQVLELLRTARSTAETRVIVVTAKKDESDRIRGLELGADDYVAKPFSPRELVLRVRAVLQRGAARPAEQGGVLEAGPIRVDTDAHEVRVFGEPVRLTLTEFRLLADLIGARGRVRSRERLLFSVWGYDTEVMSRTVDTHIRRLRAKLGRAATWLDTVRGIGYRVQDPAERT